MVQNSSSKTNEPTAHPSRKPRKMSSSQRTPSRGKDGEDFDPQELTRQRDQSELAAGSGESSGAASSAHAEDEEADNDDQGVEDDEQHMDDEDAQIAREAEDQDGHPIDYPEDDDEDMASLDEDEAMMDPESDLLGGSVSFAADMGLMASLLSGSQPRYRNMLSALKSRKNPSGQLFALQELSEALSLASEDTLAGYFPTESFVRELIYIMGGPKPPSPTNAANGSSSTSGVAEDDEDDDAAATAQALADAGLVDQGEMTLLACRCLANLIEAMPHTAHTVVANGAVPVLLSKLVEIEFIDLAEQTLQTLEKISVDYPASIVREGGLMAMLQYLDFFNIHIQRTAMLAVSHCCRKLSAEHFDRVQEVVPIIRNVLSYADQRLVESACKCVVRMVESYRHQVDLLERLLDQDLVEALNAHLLQGTPSTSGSGVSTSTSIGASIYTDLLKSLGMALKASPRLSVTLLEANIVDTLYHLLTGCAAPAEDGTGGTGPAAVGSTAPAAQLESSDPLTADAAAVAVVGQAGDSVGSVAVADMAVLQNLAHRPKEQIQEALSLVGELLPPVPRDGVFDSRAYTEKAWIKRRKAERNNREKAKSRSMAPTLSTNQTNGAASTGPADADLSSSSRMPDESAKLEKPAKTEKELVKEEAQTRRTDMLKERPNLVKRLTQLLLPTLVEVYAASVALHVRQKVLIGLLKIVNFVEPSDLNEVLNTVPLASFVASIMSTRDDFGLVNSALQLVELLCQKLPMVYSSLLRREGVMWEIADIASQTPSTTKYSNKTSTAPSSGTASSQPSASSPTRLVLPGASASTTTEGSATDSSPLSHSPTRPFSGSSAASLLAGSPAFRLASDPTLLSEKKAEVSSADVGKDAIIWRARILRDMFQKEAANAEGGADHAEKSLQEIKALVASLNQATSLGLDHAKSSLQGITALFMKADSPISSFELLRSGLVDGLCSFAVGDSPEVPIEKRRELLLAALTTPQTSGSNGEGGAALVRRLQESLSRLESVEIATALSSPSDDLRRPGTGGLQRQFRLRLQSDDADAPRSCNNLVVGIPAIASFGRLADFLRPKLNAAATVAALGSGASDNSRLSSVLAALTRDGGAFGPGSALAAALAAGRGLSGSSSAPAASNARDTAVTSAGASTSTNTSPSDPAPRRRSSRLTSKKSGDDLEGGAEKAADATSGSDEHSESAAENIQNKDKAPATDASATAGRRQSGLEEMAAREGLTSEEMAQQIMDDLMPGEYDEDDDVSDDDLQPQIFEDEIGPEGESASSPVADKTINLSVGADGKKVEASTPEGTRIGTPSTSATPAAGAAGSSSSPTRPSYAAALQRKPTDFHVEFSFDGQKVDLDSTIYSAVHRLENSPERKQAAAAATSSTGASTMTFGSSLLRSGIWGNVYTVKYKKVDGPAPTAAPEQSPEPGAVSQNSLADLPESIASNSPFAKILQLLHILYELNSEWRAVRLGDVANADKAAAINESAFVNHKLTAKLNRQLEEPMIVASKCLPEWSLQLPRKFPFLFPFEARYAFLQSTSFGYSRMLQRWQNIANRNSDSSAGSSSRLSDTSLADLARLPRTKVRIVRSNVLPSVFRVMEVYAKKDSILEVEYFDEVGTGLGPTLEFYSMASKEFATKKTMMWRDDGPADSKSPYVYAPNGLFPLAISEGQIATAQGEHRVLAFKRMGQFVAKALLDSRIIDCNFSPLFMRAVLNQRIVPSLSTLRMVDSTLAKSLDSLQTMTSEDLSALSLDFTLPGDANFELVPGGKSKLVDSENVGSYIEKVADAVLGSGVRPLIRAFRSGFNLIFPIASMTSFTADELVMLFGNTEEDWSESTLQGAIKPDHGYNSESQAFQDLLSIMAEFNLSERREFLQWLTGSPKLPIGGFGGLQPRLTVVKRPAEAPLKADDYLASNMSCANFLKLPEYSNREVMKKRLETAVREGAGSFNLS